MLVKYSIKICFKAINKSTEELSPVSIYQKFSTSVLP